MAALVGFFGLFLAVYGDPLPPTQPGTVSVSYEWLSDGHLEVDLQDDSRRLDDQRRYADALIPSLFPAGTAVDVSFPEDSRASIYHVHARSRDRIAPTDEDLSIDMGRFVSALPNVGAQTADVSVGTPRVDNTVQASVAPSFDYKGAFGWSRVDASQVPSWTVTLEPDGAPWLVAMLIVACGAVIALAAAVVVSHRAARGTTAEARARLILILVMVASGFGWVAAGFVAARFDEVALAYEFADRLPEIATWAPMLLYTVAGLWAFLAMFASGFRDAERRKLLPPPPIPSPA
jgi:hypothetical protein